METYDGTDPAQMVAQSALMGLDTTWLLLDARKVQAEDDPISSILYGDHHGRKIALPYRNDSGFWLGANDWAGRSSRYRAIRDHQKTETEMMREGALPSSFRPSIPATNALGKIVSVAISEHAARRERIQVGKLLGHGTLPRTWTFFGPAMVVAVPSFAHLLEFELCEDPTRWALFERYIVRDVAEEFIHLLRQFPCEGQHVFAKETV